MKTPIVITFALLSAAAAGGQTPEPSPLRVVAERNAAEGKQLADIRRDSGARAAAARAEPARLDQADAEALRAGAAGRRAELQSLAARLDTRAGELRAEGERVQAGAMVRAREAAAASAARAADGRERFRVEIQGKTDQLLGEQRQIANAAAAAVTGGAAAPALATAPTPPGAAVVKAVRPAAPATKRPATGAAEATAAPSQSLAQPSAWECLIATGAGAVGGAKHLRDWPGALKGGAVAFAASKDCRDLASKWVPTVPPQARRSPNLGWRRDGTD